MFVCPWENPGPGLTGPMAPTVFTPVAGQHEHAGRPRGIGPDPGPALVCGHCGRCQRCGLNVSRKGPGS